MCPDTCTKVQWDLADQDDLRGIAVGTALSKLYSTVLLIRMDRVGKSAKANEHAGRQLSVWPLQSDNVLFTTALEMARKMAKPFTQLL